MESEVSTERHYEVPFNILICDITEKSFNNSTLLSLLLGKDLLELKEGETSFIHPKWKWRLTPTTLEEIPSKLDQFSKEANPELKHTMLLLKTEEITNNPGINSLFEQIRKISPHQQPMTTIITSKLNETIETINDLIGERRIDKSSFSIINDPNNNDKLLKMIYVKCYSSCSYYNGLGDQYIFSKEMQEIAPGQVITQRFNIFIVGRPGSGKSTFINSMLGEKRSIVGDGLRATNKIVQYHHSKYPLSFYDTPSIEDEKDVDAVLQSINSLNTDKIKRLHLIIYFIPSQGRTILEVDKQCLTKFQQWRKANNQDDIPLVFLIGKSQTRKEGRNLKSILINNLTNDFVFPYAEIFPIEMSDIYQTYKPFGLKEFMEWLYARFSPQKYNDEIIQRYSSATTEKAIYDLNQSKYFLSQMTSKDIILKSCKGIALSIVGGFSLIGGAEGLIPLPFADILGLLLTQIAMVSAVSLVYGIRRETNQIKQWLGSLTLCGAVNGVVFGASLLKFIPFVGMVTGGIIATLTTGAIGLLSISFCESNFDVEILKEWCLKAIDNYNSAIESFKELKEHFNTIETNSVQEEENEKSIPFEYNFN